MTRPDQYQGVSVPRTGGVRFVVRSLTTALLLSGLLASSMPASADTGVPLSNCGCATKGPVNPNPSGGRAVINDELSEGDEVVVEFVPSDLPASTQGAVAPVPASGGDTAVTGGEVQNDTSIAVDAQGGDADAAASGGDFNLTEVIAGNNSNVAADAGSGGLANADASGGVVVIGNVNSGNNQGSQIEVNQLSTGKILCFTPEGRAVVEVPTRLSQPAGNVAVDAGTVTNETNIAVSAAGGNANSDASGGDGNIVVVNGGRGNVDASAGSGGTANSDASGGTVVIGDVNSGGNTGNQVRVRARDLRAERQRQREERRAARQGDCAPAPCETTNGNLNSIISGGSVSNDTDVAVDASGGTANADASGGDDNIVEVQGGGNVDASAGTGGVANADASGGAVEIGTVRSGGNVGNEIALNNVAGELLCLSGSDQLLLVLDLAPTGTGGSTGVNGGTVTNDTDIAVDAGGGNAASDASGGDNNIVTTSGGGGNVEASAGSGGTANSDASGGTVVIGDVNSGGNTGNDVNDDDEDDEDDD